MKLGYALSLLVMGMMATQLSAANLSVGDKAPAFEAVGVDGKTYSLEGTSKADVVVVCFTCNACPVAIDYEDRFIDFANEYKNKSVKFIAINVNPESLDEMKSRAEEKGFPYPYAKDESGNSARAYGARVTPHLFVLDKDRNVAYIGAFDDNTSAAAAKKQYVKAAVDSLLAGKAVEVTETKPVGCGIRIKR